MKLKKILSLCLLSSLISVQAFPLGVLAEEGSSQENPAVALAEEAPQYELRSFVISAYYSPLPGQSYYTTGSYEGDIRLNGNGTNGASGAEVFPGMIAAPKTYSFGTELDIPGVCTGCQVQDRGGAIVPAGERGHAYDRLDIWMGYGDSGLTRALNWGKRTVHEVKVYYTSTGRSTDFFYDPAVYVTPTSSGTTFTPSSLTFPTDLYSGSNGAQVLKMQQYLLEWGYLQEATGFYGDQTVEALYQLQFDFGIVQSPEAKGAGHFGTNTRKRFEELIKAGDEAKSIVAEKRSAQLLQQYPELKEERAQLRSGLGLGDSGEQVTLLQELLIEMGYLRIDSTGYYGAITEHAVYKFQQSKGLVTSVSDPAAGYVGPATRQVLNEILNSKIQMKEDIALMRVAVDSGEHTLSIPSQVVVVFKEEE